MKRREEARKKLEPHQPLHPQKLRVIAVHQVNLHFRSWREAGDPGPGWSGRIILNLFYNINEIENCCTEINFV